MTKATLYLIRHAETPANVGAKRVRGNLDVPLDANGVAQAQAVGAEFQGLPVKVIFSSDLKRTIAVAQQIAQATGAQVSPTPALRSWDRGRYTGELEDQVKPYIDWYVRHPQETIPGGESLAQFIERFGTFLLQQLQTLERNPEAGPFADVTHAWGLNATLAILSGGKEDIIEGSAPPPGSILRLDWDGKEWELSHHRAAAKKTQFRPEPQVVTVRDQPSDTELPGPATLRTSAGQIAYERQRGFTKNKQQPPNENLFMGKKGNSFL